MQRYAVDHGQVQQRQKLKVEFFGLLDSARPVQVVDLHLHIDHAASRHIATSAARELIGEVDAIRAAKYAQTIAGIQLQNLADMLQNGRGLLFDVLDIGFGRQQLDQLGWRKRGTNGRGRVLNDERQIKLRQLPEVFAYLWLGRFAQIGRHSHQCADALLAGMLGELKRDPLVQALYADDQGRTPVNPLGAESHDLLAFGIA